MINAKQDPKCSDLVQEKFNETEADYKKAREFFEEYQDATEGEQIAMKVFDKHRGDYFHEYEDLFDYVNQTALSWDYVEGEGREAGYYRLQLSWGGPSDEFRIYVNQDKEIDIIEYWYMDWFDSAHYLVAKYSDCWHICDQFLECERWK
jgi:hypothetical protein